MSKLTDEIQNNIENKDNMITAQQESLVELSKKINTLQTENEVLKTQINDLTKELNWGESKNLESLGDEDAEIICKNQINRLKDTSNERVLTAEESRKLETFVKVLSQIRLKNKSGQDSVQKMPDEQLLKLVENDDE